MVVVRAGAICLNPGGSILAQFVPIFVLANWDAHLAPLFYLGIKKDTSRCLSRHIVAYNKCFC